ncbi:hypothetical protein WG66_003780 [Moniliophthora roreri]|nr:hypothetical protein WG66_003780 [Moniliophthora roreri]
MLSTHALDGSVTWQCNRTTVLSQRTFEVLRLHTTFAEGIVRPSSEISQVQMTEMVLIENGRSVPIWPALLFITNFSSKAGTPRVLRLFIALPLEPQGIHLEYPFTFHSLVSNWT